MWASTDSEQPIGRGRGITVDGERATEEPGCHEGVDRGGRARSRRVGPKLAALWAPSPVDTRDIRVSSRSLRAAFESDAGERIVCLSRPHGATVLSAQGGGPEKGLQFSNPHHLGSGSN